LYEVTFADVLAFQLSAIELGGGGVGVGVGVGVGLGPPPLVADREPPQASIESKKQLKTLRAKHCATRGRTPISRTGL
jgi:hypothetical protein